MREVIEMLSFVPVLVAVLFVVAAFCAPQTAFSPARWEKASK